MFRSIIAVMATLAVSGFVHAQNAVPWTEAEGGNGHWYQRVPTSPGDNFDLIRQTAVNVGADLASITSSEEDSFVAALANGSVGLGVIIGTKVTDPTCDVFTWSDGSEWTYENWGTSPTQPECVLDEAIGYYADGWHDLQIVDIDASIFEWSADCNGDGIVDYGQILDGSLDDVNGNGIPDTCDLEGLSDPIQWSESEGGNGHWYAYVQSASPSCWETDREMAEGMGGYLATITNEAENSFLGQLAQPFYPLSAAANIGGYQDLEDPDYSEPGGAWKWVTGEPFEYTNWQGGEPGCCGPNEDWLDFNAQSSQWRDRVNCLPNEETTSQWSLIEWSDDCNGDGIVDYGQILNGELTDCDGNGVPDICELEELKMGACCLSGNCVVTTASNCFDAQGAYAGDDISCADADCPSPCPGDIDGDGQVGIVDILVVIDRWGFCP